LRSLMRLTPHQQRRRYQGNSIWPLYLPPESVSVRLSYVYVPPPLAPWYLPVPPVILNKYSLRCEPSSQVSDNLSPPLKVRLQVPVPFQLSSGMYSYFPTQSSVAIGVAVGSSGMFMHRPAKSTNLWPFSGSDAFHLSVTHASAPTLLMVLPALAAPIPSIIRAAGTLTNS